MVVLVVVLVVVKVVVTMVIRSRGDNLTTVVVKYDLSAAIKLGYMHSAVLDPQ